VTCRQSPIPCEAQWRWRMPGMTGSRARTVCGRPEVGANSPRCLARPQGPVSLYPYCLGAASEGARTGCVVPCRHAAPSGRRRGATAREERAGAQWLFSGVLWSVNPCMSDTRFMDVAPKTARCDLDGSATDVKGKRAGYPERRMPSSLRPAKTASSDLRALRQSALPLL